jgi:ADP-ribosylglycohydrolase
MLERIHGCLAGLALGDALGMPVEFLTPEEISEQYGTLRRLEKAPPNHPHFILEPGTVTDDTGLALATAHAYAPDGEITAEKAARQLLDWEDTTPRAVLDVVEGPSTRAALAEIRKGGNPRETGRNGRTNGAAMRMAAVGLMNAGDIEGAMKDALEASLPTHGSRAAMAGAASVACAVATAAAPGAGLDAVLQAAVAGAQRGAGLGSWSWSTPLAGRIELAERLVGQAVDEASALRDLYDFVGVDMLVPESVAAAMGVVLLAKGDPMRAVLLGANIGGDADTIAAIAGQICGALAGIRAFDAGLLAEMEKVNHISLEEESHRLYDLSRIRAARRSHG